MGTALWRGRLARRVDPVNKYHPPRELGAMPEGKPTAKASDEDAAHFLVRMVHKFPHEVTIYEGGPMTNLALAITIDPEFPESGQRVGIYGRAV